MCNGYNDGMGNQASKKVLIIGGGIAGLTAAWELARLDVDVELVEKSPFLGGHAIQFCCKAAEACQKCNACSVEKRLLEVIEEIVQEIEHHFCALLVIKSLLIFSEFQSRDALLLA